MAEVNETDFESREYQDELFLQAIDQNLILYLPTGSGKTFIAILLIKHFNGNNEMRTIQDGGKRTVFLVNTVALVQQQAKQIRAQTVYNVGTYSGDMGVDMWDAKVWLIELNTHQVLVMTSQIFLDLLSHNIMSIKNINLIIFDECHRAVSNHPMRQIMMKFELVDVNNQPRVLGLTATLLNGNTTAAQLPREIKDLEVTFNARIATSINEEMVKMYSTNPKVHKVTYMDNSLNSPCYAVRDAILNNFKRFVDLVEVEEANDPLVDIKAVNLRRIDDASKKTNKRLKNLVEDIKVNMNDLGVYGGNFTVLAHLVAVQQMTANVQSEAARLLYQSIITTCTLLRKYFEIEMNRLDVPRKDILQQFSSDKVIKLVEVFKKLNKKDSAIVFVKRRFTAKILYYLVKKASADDPKLKHIKCNFVVGYNVSNPFKDTRENYLQRAQNVKVLNMFNQGELNVLFASNAVEEGIDITRCNNVIMFDHPQDFRSYIQSKGRARDRESMYVMMISESNAIKFHQKYIGFAEVEQILQKMLYGGKAQDRQPPTQSEIQESLYSNREGLVPFRPIGFEGPEVTCLSAVSLINRYFASLKHDKFTKICPFWYIEEDRACKFRCHLKFPLESKITEVLKGAWQTTREDAKRSVALVAIQILYEKKQLQTLTLLPLAVDDSSLNVNTYTPTTDTEVVFEKKVGKKTVQVGTKKYKRVLEKKWADCLCECRPEPDQQAYLHILDMEPMDTPPDDNNRLRVVHETYSLPNTFAIVSTKQLPEIAPFPMYTSTGELEVCVRQTLCVHLDRKQVQEIEDFHLTLFDKVVAVAKAFMVKDMTNTINSYLIAPVKLDGSQQYVVDFDVIRKLRRPFPSTNNRPSKDERAGLNITHDNYNLAIVSPWYRSIPIQKYLITKVCHDMSEETHFPTQTYKTYKEYFIKKYKIEPMIKNQPLIEVRTLSSRINCIKPRALTKTLKRKMNENNEDYEVWLLPEFCVVYPFPGEYWLKADLLPSILHRISRLCLAEELRSAIAQETGVGVIVLPKGKCWNKLEEELSLAKKDDEPELAQALKPLTLMSKTVSPSKSIKQVWGDEPEPLDIERFMDCATIFDIMNYNHFVKSPLIGEATIEDAKKSREEMTSVVRPPAMKMVQPPPLKMIGNNIEPLGPQQVELMQALTAASANDFLNCERLETLGDSFLKLAISLILFETHPDYLEGQLTHIKGAIVGNKNLYFCGTKKNFGCMLEVQDFSPREEWVAPGYCIDHRIKNAIIASELDPDCLYNLTIPEEERRTGQLSSGTIDMLNDILFNSDDIVVPKSCTFLNQHALTNKNISDSVEAVLGVYLKSCGIIGALKVMNWFEITNTNLSHSDIFTKPHPTAVKGKEHPNVHLQNPKDLEDILNYKFKDRSYMLQALAHPSYSRNNTTLCYQRLEFLGDALIDFLITVHIFEKCESLSPGDLTDLRSALVNNVTLGALSVRHQLYKFMLYQSSKLNDCMMRFVNHQEDRSHVIDDDILFLVEEKDVNISESIDVPKALGDIFEALIGAIYLDSGKNLDVVWKVVYNLMRDEIETFYQNIPKNTVRMLYETNYSPKFSSAIQSDGAVMVTVEITYKGSVIRFNGFGDNKHESKRAAAKHAMRYIRTSTV